MPSWACPGLEAEALCSPTPSLTHPSRKSYLETLIFIASYSLLTTPWGQPCTGEREPAFLGLNFFICKMDTTESARF